MKQIAWLLNVVVAGTLFAFLLPGALWIVAAVTWSLLTCWWFDVFRSSATTSGAPQVCVFGEELHAVSNLDVDASAGARALVDLHEGR